MISTDRDEALDMTLAAMRGEVYEPLDIDTTNVPTIDPETLICGDTLTAEVE